MSWKVIDDTIRSISFGSSLNAQRTQALERYKEQHKQQEQLWIAYVHDMSRQASAGGGVVKEQFFPFESEEYGGCCFGLAYLVKAFIETVESYLEYYNRKNQMIDGRHLKVDHSFKITKCIRMDGSIVFEGMFTIMNEYGQIVAYWFTHGSNLGQLRANILQLAQRYKMHGFPGPDTLTTDRCCQERTFWEGSATDEPIFDTLKINEAVEAINVKTIVLPASKIKFATNMTLARVLANEILASLAAEGQQRTIFVDCKRALSHQRADVVQVGLWNGIVYVF